jgi:hypothetical protein
LCDLVSLQLSAADSHISPTLIRKHSLRVSEVIDISGRATNRFRHPPNNHVQKSEEIFRVESENTGSESLGTNISKARACDIEISMDDISFTPIAIPIHSPRSNFPTPKYLDMPVSKYESLSIFQQNCDTEEIHLNDAEALCFNRINQLEGCEHEANTPVLEIVTNGDADFRNQDEGFEPAPANMSGDDDAIRSNLDDVRINVETSPPSVADLHFSMCPICLDEMSVDPSLLCSSSCRFASSVAQSIAATLSSSNLSSLGDRVNAPTARAPCGHVYHAGCITMAMAHAFEQQQQPACPMCRAPFVRHNRRAKSGSATPEPGWRVLVLAARRAAPRPRGTAARLWFQVGYAIGCACLFSMMITLIVRYVD